MSVSRFFKSSKERSLANIPAWILPLLFIIFVVQISWHKYQPEPIAVVRVLNSPPSDALLNINSFGDRVAFSKLTMLWLQSHDNQPGISIPFRELDYDVLSEWLTAILVLDSKTDYPLLSAARVYAEVPVIEKQRTMLSFVEQEFYKDPNNRWQWLAHAAFVAKHRIKDEKLALKFAQALAEHATGEQVPSWAKQMHIFLLEDIGEIESAKILLGGLLESGKIQDPNEQRFLHQRLQELEQKSAVLD